MDSLTPKQWNKIKALRLIRVPRKTLKQLRLELWLMDTATDNWPQEAALKGRMSFVRFVDPICYEKMRLRSQWAQQNLPSTRPKIP